MEKVTCSEIAYLLAYPVRVNELTPYWLAEIIARGRMIHQRLGFDNIKSFQRILKLNGGSILITGLPDRIDNNFCYEFKTFSRKTRKKVVKCGEIQCKCYTFITGLPSKLVLYDVEKEKIVSEKIIRYSPKEFKRIVKKALQIQKLIREFKQTYKKIQNGV